MHIEETRPQAPSSGNPMDGESVGVVPLDLCIPNALVQVEAIGPMGRSIFSSQFVFAVASMCP